MLRVGLPLIASVQDGSTSTGAANGRLNYTWFSASGQSPSGLSSPTGSRVTYVPPAAGVLGITLSVRNGVCQDSRMTLSIDARCLTMTAQLSQGASGLGAQMSYSVVFDGTKFPRVELDASQSVYKRPDGSSGNFERLKYVWEMTLSPVTSWYEAYRLAHSEPNPSAPPQCESPDIADVNSTCRRSSYLCRTATTVTSYRTRVTLANKHYNRPMTCFVPDKPGQYEVKLTISDSCTTSTAIAQITASCRNIIGWSFDVAMPRQLMLNTSNVNRLPLLAVPNGRSDPSLFGSLTYEWKIVAAPAASVHQVGLESITNQASPSASILVDVAGNFTFSFTANDGCNVPTIITVTVIVSCNDDITLSTLTVAPENLNFSGLGSSLPPFADSTITLSSGAASYCSGLSFRWKLVKRICAPAWVPAVAPPASAPTCPAACQKCQWKVVDEPCALPVTSPGHVNPDYRAPDLQQNRLTCEASFKPNYPGTYKLSFTVSDCCSQDTDTLTVVARCQTKVTARPLALLYTSTFACNSTVARYMFGRVSLAATADTRASLTEGPVGAVAACPVEAAPPVSCSAAANAAKITQCCKVDKCCNSESVYQCPQCAQCADCPSCYRITEYTVKAASVAQRRTTIVSRTAAADIAQILQHTFTSRVESEDARDDQGLMTYSVVPLAAVAILSLVVNGYWVNDILNTKRRLSSQPTSKGSVLDTC
jgi:hypothetical protein